MICFLFQKFRNISWWNEFFFVTLRIDKLCFLKMEEIYNLVFELEKKVLILKEKNEFLSKEISLLRNDFLLLEEKKNQIQADLEKKSTEYEILKLAKKLGNTPEERNQAKSKINWLIKEIDACILQLSK